MAFENILAGAWLAFVEYLPKIVGAIIVLVIGWIGGRLVGRGVSKILEKAGVDDAFRKTIIGKAIEKKIRR